jgi:uncharacterized membrane protein
MVSKASIGGHPIHPMLIPFPIGLLVFSVIAVVADRSFVHRCRRISSRRISWRRVGLQTRGRGKHAVRRRAES